MVHREGLITTATISMLQLFAQPFDQFQVEVEAQWHEDIYIGISGAYSVELNKEMFTYVAQFCRSALQ